MKNRQRLECLSNKVCVELGFCEHRLNPDKFSSLSKLDGDTFSQIVLHEEGMDPNREIRWQRKLKRYFTEEFGDSLELE